MNERPRFKASYALQDVGNVMATMTVTMNIEEWKSLRGRLVEHRHIFPDWKFADAIGEMIGKAQASFSAEGESTT